jgi:SAM-dependent methyltransferase
VAGEGRGLVKAWSALKRSWKQRGFVETFAFISQSRSYYLRIYLPLVWRALSRFRGRFDTETHVDTEGIVLAMELDAPAALRAQATSYVPTPPRLFRRLVGSLPIRHEYWSFVDLGSGKGRTLLLAAGYPFREVVGVEFSPELTRIAMQNIRAYRRNAGSSTRVETVCADAGEYEFNGEKLVLYLFNPFGEQVLARVLRNLKRWLEGGPHELFVIYVHPRCRAVLDEAPFLEALPAPLGCALYRGASPSVASEGRPQ